MVNSHLSKVVSAPDVITPTKPLYHGCVMWLAHFEHVTWDYSCKNSWQLNVWVLTCVYLLSLLIIVYQRPTCSISNNPRVLHPLHPATPTAPCDTPPHPRDICKTTVGCPIGSWNWNTKPTMRKCWYYSNKLHPTSATSLIQSLHV